ncbi:MAG: sigma-70 family RNA polymerase sigma factor, partial [Flavobacteriaceae bacterium]
LTQDVFLKLARSNNDGVDNLKSWVYTIAKNTITDYYRKRQLDTKPIEGDSFSNTMSPEDAGQELSKCISAFINQLPGEYRELLTLSELKEVSQKDIAAQMNMNYVTVRSKIQRGRKKLREQFENCCSVMQGGKGSILYFESKKGCDGKPSCS